MKHILADEMTAGSEERKGSKQITIECAGATHIGTVREINQDAMLMGSLLGAGREQMELSDRITERARHPVLAVADGMGGHPAGEDASRLVLKQIRRRPGNFKTGQSAKQEVHAIHERVNALGRSTWRDGMGSTLVLLNLAAESPYILNVGDSRCYRVRGQATQITRDHSMGGGTGFRAFNKHILTSCMGGGADRIKIDLFDLENDVRTGDIYVLCSDGLEDGGIESQSIAEHCADPLRPLAEVSRELLLAALRGGSSDNVTVLLARVI